MSNEFYPVSGYPQKNVSNDSLNILKKYCPDIRPTFHQIGGERSEETFHNKNLKRSFAENVSFYECDFSEAAATGVVWRNNRFIDCLFEKSDFEFADLSGSIIKQGEASKNEDSTVFCIDGAGFNATVMRNVNFYKISVKGSSFAQSDFTGSEFQDCSLQSSTFEDCLFHGSKFSNMNLRESNFEYADFKGASLLNVSISINQLPFLFGISLKDIKNNNILIYSQAQGRKDDLPLSITEIQKIKNALINYFNSIAVEFPGASLCYLFNEHDLFVDQIENGIIFAILREDYRSLKYLCKIAAQSCQERGILTKTDLRNLYDVILKRVDSSFNQAAYTQYKLHDGLIRSYLVHDRKKDTLDIIFRTASPNPNDVHLAIANIIRELLDGCDAAGIVFEICNIYSSVNSNPLIQITIGNININLPWFTTNSFKKTGNSNQQLSVRDKDERSPWNSYSKYAAIVATIAMLFSGTNVFLKATEKNIPPMNSSIEMQIIEKHHPVINQYTQKETFRIRQEIKNIVYFENGRFRAELNKSNIIEKISNNDK